MTECRDRGVPLPGSELTLLEIAGGPLRRGQDQIAAEYRIYLDRYPGLTLAPIDRATLNRAARLRTDYQFGFLKKWRIETHARGGGFGS